MSHLELLVKCECSHVRGDHKSSRPPLGRPVSTGACRFCECREFRPVEPSVEEQIDALSKAAFTPLEDCGKDAA